MGSGHDILVQRAVRWLRGHHRCRVVLAEIVCQSVPMIPDAIGWNGDGRWSVLVECKTSRADFRADADKPYRRAGRGKDDEHPGQERWFMTPPGLLKLEELPEGWGLAEVGDKSVRIVMPAAQHAHVRYAMRWRYEMSMLEAAVRRHELGVKFSQKTAKFEPWSSRGERCEAEPMTIEEAIEHAQKVAEDTSGACAESHLQLASWLLELVSLRNQLRGEDDAAR